MENQGTNEDDPQSDPHPEAGLLRSQTRQNSGPEVGAYMVTGVIEETHDGPYMVTGATERHRMVTGVIEEVRNGHDMVTAAQGEIRNDRDMVTAVQEENPYCSSGISSGKQKKARSTSQPQFRSENSPATIEAHQILFALQQLATNSNSADVNNNSNIVSKQPKSLTTTMPTFEGKSEKFELFEDLFQTSLKIHNQLTEKDKKNISTLSWVVMRRKRSKKNQQPEPRESGRISDCVP